MLNFFNQCRYCFADLCESQACVFGAYCNGMVIISLSLAYFVLAIFVKYSTGQDDFRLEVWKFDRAPPQLGGCTSERLS